jgi:hypothetical protein
MSIHEIFFQPAKEAELVRVAIATEAANLT